MPAMAALYLAFPDARLGPVLPLDEKAANVSTQMVSCKLPLLCVYCKRWHMHEHGCAEHADGIRDAKDVGSAWERE
jgi:hypothetical protein